MLYVLHGDDIINSRKRLSELALNFSSVVYLQGDKTNFSEIINSLSSTDMFEASKCVVIEGISKLAKADLDRALPAFEKVGKDKATTVILWQGTEMTKLQIGKYKTAAVESFMLPKLFFTFLDNFTPAQFGQEIKTLTDMKNVDTMQIFYALIKRVRQLLMVKSRGNFEELVKMSPWQMNKLQSQSAKFKTGELEKVYTELFTLEKKLKSSGLMLPLRDHLDIMLARELN